MVLGVISSEGHVMPPHFFEPKQKVNQEVYLEVLSNVVKPWIDTVASGRKYTFQQDSAPAHKAKTVQAWLKENVPHFWDPQTWPSNSPDLNPCDYYLYEKLEGEACATHHNSVEALKSSITSVAMSLEAAEVS
ncbi:Transposable element tcb2 transposase, partial [Caligus rogercresseyi]